jgi:predicted kinase
VSGTLVIVTGLPGAGKSTLAEKLARATGTPAFSGDWLMGALAPYGVLDGLERPAYLDMYYNLLGTLVTRQLMLGQSAIVDCLVTGDRVARWQAAAADHGGRVVVVECVCGDIDLHRSRVVGRRRDIPGWHEIDWDHVERMRSEFPPLSIEHPGVEHIVVDAVRPAEHNARLVLDRLARR